MSPTEICKSVRHHVSYLCFTVLCIIHAGVDITCQSLRARVYTVCHTEADTIYQSPRAGFSHALCMCHTNVSMVPVSHRSMYDVHA